MGNTCLGIGDLEAQVDIFVNAGLIVYLILGAVGFSVAISSSF